MSPFARAAELYKEDPEHFSQMVAWHLVCGHVSSTPDSFSLCYYCDSEDPDRATTQEEADSIYVTICVGDMLQAIAPFRERFKFLVFQRDFKKSPRVRTYQMGKFYKKIKNHGKS